MAKELTILQKRYADIYFSMKEPNQTQAYIQAGYKVRGKTAEQAACRLARNVKVRTYLDKLRTAVTKKTEITAEYVIQSLKDIADSTKIGQPVVAVRALEQLGKHLGIFKESAPHPEREKARRALQADERRALTRLARRRTEELSSEN